MLARVYLGLTVALMAERRPGALQILTFTVFLSHCSTRLDGMESAEKFPSLSTGCVVL